jgi:hypothetical protein
LVALVVVVLEALVLTPELPELLTQAAVAVVVDFLQMVAQAVAVS